MRGGDVRTPRPSTRPRSCAPGRRGSASCRWSRAAGRRCRSAGCRSTASASPICWPRARTTAGWRDTRCPRSPPSAPSWSTRRRPASIAWRRSPKGSSASPRRRCRPISTATLRAYQRQGVNWLAFLRGAGLGGVLADDMGLGKTLQAMCVFELRAARRVHPPPARADAGRLPDQRPLQLAGRAGALPPGPAASPSITGRGAASTRPPT